jgi:hypothetical protein
MPRADDAGRSRRVQGRCKGGPVCHVGRTGEQEQHERHGGRGGDAGEGEAAPGRRAAGQGRLVAERLLILACDCE